MSVDNQLHTETGALYVPTLEAGDFIMVDAAARDRSPERMTTIRLLLNRTVRHFVHLTPENSYGYQRFGRLAAISGVAIRQMESPTTDSLPLKGVLGRINDALSAATLLSVEPVHTTNMSSEEFTNFLTRADATIEAHPNYPKPHDISRFSYYDKAVAIDNGSFRFSDLTTN